MVRDESLSDENAVDFVRSIGSAMEAVIFITLVPPSLKDAIVCDVLEDDVVGELTLSTNICSCARNQKTCLHSGTTSNKTRKNLKLLKKFGVSCIYEYHVLLVISIMYFYYFINVLYIS